MGFSHNPWTPGQAASFNHESNPRQSDSSAGERTEDELLELAKLNYFVAELGTRIENIQRRVQKADWLKGNWKFYLDELVKIRTELRALVTPLRERMSVKIAEMSDDLVADLSRVADRLSEDFQRERNALAGQWVQPLALVEQFEERTRELLGSGHGDITGLINEITEAFVSSDELEANNRKLWKQETEGSRKEYDTCKTLVNSFERKITASNLHDVQPAMKIYLLFLESIEVVCVCCESILAELHVNKATPLHYMLDELEKERQQ